MKKIVLAILVCFGLSFPVKSQGRFNFSDTTFVLGQKHALQVRYGLGGQNQLIADSLTLIELDSLVQFLVRNRNISIEIGVHTDHRGSDTMNLKITQFRAQCLRDYLVSRGISLARITATGYGEFQAVVPEKEIDQYKKTDKRMYEILHQRNRRTEITIIEI